MCPRCNMMMKELVYSRVSDGAIWHCPSKNCRATVSVRKGSFFQSSHLLLTKLTDLTYFWSMEMSNNHVECHVKQHFAEFSCPFPLFEIFVIKLHSVFWIVSGVTPFTYWWSCASVSTTRQWLTGTTSWEMSAWPTCCATLFNLAVRVTSSPLTNQWLPGPSPAMAVQGLCPHSGCLGGRLGHWLFLYGATASAWCRNNTARHSTR